MNFKKRTINNNFKNNIILILLVLGGIFNDLALRTLTIGDVFKLKPIITSISIILIISVLALFLSCKNRNYVYIILSSVFSFLSAANYLYYTHFNSFISVTIFNQAKQLGKMKNSVSETLDFRVLIFAIPTILLIVIFKRLKKRGYFNTMEGMVSRRQVIRPFVLGTIMLSMVSLTLTSTDLSRLRKQWNRSYLVEQLGIYYYATADIVKSALVSKAASIDFKDFNGDLKSLVAKNNDLNLDNDYTGIFEGKDVYVIHYESAQNFAMDLSFGDGEVTPFLNKLANEGLYFNNFYPQHSIGTSSDSEFSFNTSLYPINNGTVFIDHSNKEYETIQKLLNQKGYYTMSMHGNNGDFWNRDIMHENLGYQDFISKNSYEIDEEVGLGLSDESFYRQSVQKIKEIKKEKQKPIMAKLISLSNHYPFDSLDVYGDFDTGYLEGTELSNYLKSFNYADKSLQVFIEEMDKEGLLDNAAIVIYGDHHAKISTEDYEKIYNYDETTDTILDKGDPDYISVNGAYLKQVRRTPLIIWSKDKSFAKTIDQPMGMVDVAPTLSNMLGIFNPYQMGKDIFSTEDNKVVFPDGSYIDKEFYFSSSTSKLYDIKTNELLVIEELDRDILPEIYEIEKRLELSSNIIVNDLIKYHKNLLLEQINNIKTIEDEKFQILRQTKNPN